MPSLASPYSAPKQFVVAEHACSATITRTRMRAGVPPVGAGFRFFVCRCSLRGRAARSGVRLPAPRAHLGVTLAVASLSVNDIWLESRRPPGCGKRSGRGRKASAALRYGRASLRGGRRTEVRGLRGLSRAPARFRAAREAWEQWTSWCRGAWEPGRCSQTPRAPAPVRLPLPAPRACSPRRPAVTRDPRYASQLQT